MEEEKVSAGEPVTIGAVTLLPILRTVTSCRGIGGAIVGFAAREVLGVVVISPAPVRVIDISGEEVSLELFAEQVPEVAELLAGR